jgi:predicted dienelactone hydrolase
LEFIRNIYPSYEENRIFRRAQLYERFKTIKSLLDIICSGELFEQLDPSVKADPSEISIIGHSFGGSTAVFSAFYDKRLTGACVAYDPVIDI